MHARARVGLVARALGAACIQVGVVLAIFAMLVVSAALLAVVVGAAVLAGAEAVGVDVGFPVFRPLAWLFTLGLVYATMEDASSKLHRGRRDLLAGVDADLASGGADATEGRRHAARETRRAFAATVRRLAAAADVPAPTPAVHPGETPLCYTVDHDGDVVLVVSRGLLDALPAAEREAVLAHEVAHLANRDHRVMTWAVAPLVAAEEVHRSHEDDDGWEHLSRATVLASRLGAGLFSRGRELAADRAAARLSGDPGALAAALERLDDSLDGRPPADLRDHAHARDALNLLPALDPDADGGGGPLATHPATERRVERLRALESAQETA